MGGALDRCDSDPIRVRYTLRDLGRSAGAFSVRKLFSTISRVLPVTAVAVATFMDRAAVRGRTVATSHSRLRRPVWFSARIRD